LKRIQFVLLTMFLLATVITSVRAQKKPTPKKIYFSYTLHGNMNYDRYPASTIWEKFPEAYQNILDFIESNPGYKGQMQLSGQSFKTMQMVKPDFLNRQRNCRKGVRLMLRGHFIQNR
jgi:hypothetical protein